MKRNCFISAAAALLILGAAAVIHAESPGFTGVWKTNWGRMEMTQSGAQVMGHYTGEYKGIIDGTVSGNRLSFTWSQPNGEYGKGYFIISDDGNSISGAWGTKESDSDGGSWFGTRMSGRK